MLIFVVLCPVLFIVQMSLRTGLDAFQMPPTFPFSVTLQNYVDLIEGKFVRSLVNSTVTSTSCSRGWVKTSAPRWPSIFDSCGTSERSKNKT